MRLKLSALVVTILALAMGIPSPRTQSRADVPQPLIDRVAAGDEISVIVGVGVRFVPEGSLGGASAVALQRSTIRQQVADVMSRAAAVGVAVGASFDTIPFFTARVNRTSLDALATTAGVTQIGEDARLRPTLNVSAGLVNAPSAWAAGHTGAGWGVAVLDTGVDSAHAFLGGRVSAQACYSNALGLGDPATSSVCPGGVNSDTSGGGPCPANVDGCGHGTHVAGIVAGDGGPSGARGIAPAASIVAVQVFSRLTSTDCAPAASPCTTAYTSDIIRGLQRVLALRNGGVPIAAVNMSLGGGLFPGANCDGADASISATKTAIDNLLSVGVASIVAAGNEEADGAIASPACISTAVAVGATTRGACPGSALCPTGAQAGLPNVPVFSNHSIAVDVLAPGVTITSSIPGGGFAALNGTSMAAPHVAGAWAVLKHAAAVASPSQILTALSTTGTPITEPFTGIAKPLINLNAARLHLLGGGGGLPGAPTNFVASADGNTISMSWNASADVAPIGIAAAATNYNLIARLAPASAPLVVLPLGNVTSFGVTAPSGTFFLSVQGINGAGAGPESNQVQVTTPAVPPPPGTPTNLVATVVGTSATFTWSAPTSGGPVGNYVLLAGNLPSPAPSLVSVTLPTSPTSVGFSGIPPGVWYVRVFAQNTGGNSANSSNQVQFTIAGPAPPGAPTLNAPVVVARNVTLSWTPSAGSAATSYTLLASSTSGGAPFLSVPGLSGTGAAFGGVPSGTYFLRLVAVNAVGGSAPSNQVTLVVP